MLLCAPNGGVADEVSWTVVSPACHVDGLPLTKQVGCKGTHAQVWVAWQVKTRAPAQAGNRTSRTEHYLQWWEHGPEWNAVTTTTLKRRDLSFLPPREVIRFL